MNSKPLFDMSDRNLIDPSKEYSFECCHCSDVFSILGKYVRYEMKHNFDSKSEKSFKYCSKKCSQLSQIVSVIEQCCQCGKDIEIMPSEKKKSKSGRMFCNRSCSATYHNSHKTTGTRRSKLEVWLESELEKSNSELKIDYNLTTAIEQELDIYLPELKLAIEINGIFHYKPIFGDKKFQRTQATDIKKKINCINSNITLIIIDVSTYNCFKPETAQPFLHAILKIIEAKSIAYHKFSENNSSFHIGRSSLS